MVFLLYKANNMVINQLAIILEFCLGMAVLAGLLLLLGRLKEG
jgi:predicted lysophospholipase L1 biosynthesis ABC-type transport system permease subunit